MHSSFWKLTALAVVIGVGFLAVAVAQFGLQNSRRQAAEDFTTLGESDEQFGEPEAFPEEEDDGPSSLPVGNSEPTLADPEEPASFAGADDVEDATTIAQRSAVENPEPAASSSVAFEDNPFMAAGAGEAEPEPAELPDGVTDNPFGPLDEPTVVETSAPDAEVTESQPDAGPSTEPFGQTDGPTTAQLNATEEGRFSVSERPRVEPLTDEPVIATTSFQTTEPVEDEPGSTEESTAQAQRGTGDPDPSSLEMPIEPEQFPAADDAAPLSAGAEDEPDTVVIRPRAAAFDSPAGRRPSQLTIQPRGAAPQVTIQQADAETLPEVNPYVFGNRGKAAGLEESQPQVVPVAAEQERSFSHGFADETANETSPDLSEDDVAPVRQRSNPFLSDSADDEVPAGDFGDSKPTPLPQPASQADDRPDLTLEFGGDPSIDPEPLPTSVQETPADRPVETVRVEPADERSEDEPVVEESVVETQPQGSQPGAADETPDSLMGDAVVRADVPVGPLQPELKIEKIAPESAILGEPVIYSIVVRNVGTSAATNVVVEDRIPKGTELNGTIPQAELSQKRLFWRWKEIKPQEEKTIKIRVIPREPGEIGSVATVSFTAEVAATIRVSPPKLPKLVLDVIAQDEAVVGDVTTLNFTIRNEGEADAQDVLIRSIVPPQMKHPGGADLEYEIGTLAVGQSTDVELALTAVDAGAANARTILTAKGIEPIEETIPFSVLQSRLSLTRKGPARRFVGRTASFTNTIANESNAPIPQIQVTEIVPPGLQFDAASHDGSYDPQRRTITWIVPSLPPQAQLQLVSTLRAEAAGQYDTQVHARTGRGDQAKVDGQLVAAGFSSLSVGVDHAGQPVAVGEQVSLRLNVRNRGTDAAANVQMVFTLPEQVEFVAAKGPVEYEQSGREIRFSPVEQLPVAANQSFDIILTAARSGDARVKVRLESDDLSAPLTDEESIIIFEE